METIIHILLWGSLLSISSFVILIGSWIIDPKVWAADLGAEPQYQNKIGGIITVIILLVVQVSVMAIATMQLELIKVDLSFWSALFINYLCYQLFNILDLFLLDWFLYMKIKPTFMRPDYLPVADNFSKHVADFRNGLLIALFPVIVSTMIGI